MTRRFLSLGDSYTIGEGVDASQRWPVQLAVALRSAGVVLAEPRIIARTGWTTSELLAAINAISPPLERDFDLVTLLVGVNDQYRGHGLATFRAGFQSVFDRAVSFGGGDARRALVVSIPDWSVTPFAASDPRGATFIAGEIYAFNQVAREVALAAGAVFIDVTADSQLAAQDRTLLVADKLHPSGSMYALWVERILPVARRALEA